MEGVMNEAESMEIDNDEFNDAAAAAFLAVTDTLVSSIHNLVDYKTDESP